MPQTKTMFNSSISKFKKPMRGLTLLFSKKIMKKILSKRTDLNWPKSNH